MSRTPRLAGLLALVAVGLASPSLGGCTTDAFCFNDCPGDVQSGSVASGTGGHAGDISVGSNTGGCSIFGCGGDGGAGGGACQQTNGGIEICDGLDNDCNGAVDDGPDIDFNSITTCGTCTTSCIAAAENCADIECVPSANPGTDPGTCKCNGCDPGFIDLDNDGVTCEVFCIPNPAKDESECDGADNDCDGLTDEDVDVCTSLTDCGKCGKHCVVLHGTPECVNDGSMPCDDMNTFCQIQSCDCNGPGDCWWNRDGSPDNGCEYQCDLTNGGVEICGDSLDNDCDGDIDDADTDLTGDPQIGVVCYGDPDGECHTAPHAGTTICQGHQVVCSGNLLHENDVLETCNGLDDDCDGMIDDSPVDAGGSCPGGNNVFPCNPGIEQCQNGALVCVGKVDPVAEICNGQDDNCDGTIDKTGVNPPADSVGPCDVPPPAPPNATTPCVAGSKACVGGTIVCQGSIKLGDPGTSSTDACGVDSNCDGTLTNQPNTQTDPHHCGNCTTDCFTGAVHAQWGCTAGACVFLGCDGGYYDLNSDQKCEYPCAFVSAQESCNGIDDNCNGQIDEGVVAPSPVSVCGVSPSAVSPECKSTAQGGSIAVACNNGSWSCTFAAGVCNPTCAAATEVCDTLDNNCNGLVNENTPNYGQPCATPASDGACQGFGTFMCSGPNATVCSAVKKDCATLPGGCTEACDGVDNDCDGLVDEPFINKGSNAAFFVKPVVTKLANVAAGPWIYSYEASRPSATAVIPGTGNGFECVNTGGPNCTFVVNGNTKTVPAPPANTPANATPACSVPSKIPWFNASPTEVEHACTAMGGSVCSLTQWQTGCQATIPCTWGYNPRGAACTSTFVAGTKFCNLGPSYDFSGIPGDQDGLLPTASNLLLQCFADWSGLNGNTAATNKVFDITGNLREITKDAGGIYRLMGGAFNSQDANGATCGFSFYSVDKDFKFYDTGFRCCFTSDPTL